MQSLQNIAVINGRPSVWGDAMKALVMAHHSCEWIKEVFDDATMAATCVCKRKGQPEQSMRFSKKDAESAGLWGKQGPWKQYPKRMLQMRARGFALRDVWPDVLRGLITSEEAGDYQDEQNNTGNQQRPERPAPAPAPVKEQPIENVIEAVVEEIPGDAIPAYAGDAEAPPLEEPRDTQGQAEHHESQEPPEQSSSLLTKARRLYSEAVAMGCKREDIDIAIFKALGRAPANLAQENNDTITVIMETISDVLHGRA
jgi:hypothetical protein